MRASKQELLGRPPHLKLHPVNGLAEQLRCLVCQNESLAGSRSDL
ncbi:MAG: hypothetical protein EB072_13045, partial [Betaproteobacteria bacterium]|nr:hypothetical protein [Betaproteobacteria bacterium]